MREFDFPQGLKPNTYNVRSGVAEGVPFQGAFVRPVLGLRARIGEVVVLPKRIYFVVAATFVTGKDARSRERDFAMVRVRVRAAKPAPNANRMTGPKLLAAATPTKYRPGIEDSNLDESTG